MSNINIRTSFAFDPETAEDVKELALHWGVSQSEAVRRAVKQARRHTRSPYEGMAPAEVLEHCFHNPLGSQEELQRRQDEALEMRRGWPAPGQR